MTKGGLTRRGSELLTEPGLMWDQVQDLVSVEFGE